MERVNKNLKVGLHDFHSQNQTNWDQNLHWFQLAFKTATHARTASSLTSFFLTQHNSFYRTGVEHGPFGSPLHLRLPLIVCSLQRWSIWPRVSSRHPNPYKSGDWVIYPREHHIHDVPKRIKSELVPLCSRPIII